MKIYKITNGNLKWEARFETEQEWLAWKSQADSNGWYGENYTVEIEDYVFPIEQVRAKRNLLLKESDAYLFEDFPIPQNVTKEQILTYRQALRDMTQGLNLTVVKSLDDVVFPTKPF